MISPKNDWKNTYVTHVHIVALRILQEMMLQKMTTLMVFFLWPKGFTWTKIMVLQPFCQTV